MGLSLLLPPAVEPVSVEHLKAHMRIDHAEDDRLIAALLVAAREEFERTANRAIVAQTWVLTYPGWVYYMRLPRPPLQTVAAVAYRDTTNILQTLAADQYIVDASSQDVGAQIVPAYGVTWPTLYSCDRHVPNAATVQYVAGFAVPVSVDATTNIFTSSGRDFVDGEAITFSMVAEDGPLPAPLSASQLYYVRDAAAATFKVSETLAGAALDITGETTNQMFVGRIPEGIRNYLKLMVAHRYENREASIERSLNPVPMAAESLFWAHRALEA